MAIKDMMTRGVEVVRPDDTIQAAARKMAARDIGFLPVCDGERIIGVLTDRDLAVRAVAEGKAPGETEVRQVMTEEVAWCFEDEDVERIAARMKEERVRRVIVVSRDKRLVGVVALGDLASQASGQSHEVLEEVSQAPPSP